MRKSAPIPVETASLEAGVKHRLPACANFSRRSNPVQLSLHPTFVRTALLLSAVYLVFGNSRRHLVEALRKTLERLEADPSVDQQDPAFIQLKCTLLLRLLHVHHGTAHAESAIHLVENEAQARFRVVQLFEPNSAVAPADDKVDESATA